MKPIVQSALKWALIGGLSIIILQTVLLLINPMTVGGNWVMLVYLPLIFCMIFGGITIRKENGGTISYKDALFVVLIMAVVGSTMLNIYIYEIWMKLIDPDFTQKVLQLAEQQMRDQQDKYNLTDEQVDQQIKFLRSMNFEKWAYVISAVCSIILSLIIAAFVSRPDKAVLKPEENPEVKPEA